MLIPLLKIVGLIALPFFMYFVVKNLKQISSDIHQIKEQIGKQK